MKHDKLQDFLLRFGSNPAKSIKLFVIGLMLFFAALSLIYFGSANGIWWQIVGIGVMIVAVITALVGYFGILANRVAFFRNQVYKTQQKYKDLD